MIKYAGKKTKPISKEKKQQMKGDKEKTCGEQRTDRTKRMWHPAEKTKNNSREKGRSRENGKWVNQGRLVRTEQLKNEAVESQFYKREEKPTGKDKI